MTTIIDIYFASKIASSLKLLAPWTMTQNQTLWQSAKSIQIGIHIKKHTLQEDEALVIK